jgi:hypothetical protein
MLFELLVKLVTPKNIMQLFICLVLSIVTVAVIFTVQGFVDELFTIPLVGLLTLGYTAIYSSVKIHLKETKKIKKSVK